MEIEPPPEVRIVDLQDTRDEGSTVMARPKNRTRWPHTLPVRFTASMNRKSKVFTGREFILTVHPRHALSSEFHVSGKDALVDFGEVLQPRLQPVGLVGISTNRIRFDPTKIPDERLIGETIAQILGRNFMQRP